MAHGHFRQKAAHAGMSTHSYARKHAHTPGKLGTQARSALSMMGMPKPPAPKPRTTPSPLPLQTSKGTMPPALAAYWAAKRAGK